MNQNTICPGGVLIVPENLVIQNFAHIGQLICMHQNLIRLYEEESRLKKQHKAYLHIREYAEGICEEDKYAMLRILAEYRNPEFRNCIRAFEEDPAGEKKEEPEDEQAQSGPEQPGEEKSGSMEETKLHDFTAFDTVLCKGCRDYGSCFEKKLEFLSKEIARKETEEPDCETVREKKEKELTGKPADDGNGQTEDTGPAPEAPARGMILMTADTLGVMQDDIIAMADKIDHLTDALKAVASGQCVETDCVARLIENASTLADEVCSRWEDAELEKIA